MANDEAARQPKGKPAAQVTPTPGTNTADPATENPSANAKANESANTPNAVNTNSVVTRETTMLRCPNCNRTAEWQDDYLAMNRGRRVACPKCGETMALP